MRTFFFFFFFNKSVPIFTHKVHKEYLSYTNKSCLAQIFVFFVKIFVYFAVKKL
jgi:hypothetical protein